MGFQKNDGKFHGMSLPPGPKEAFYFANNGNPQTKAPYEKSPVDIRFLDIARL